MDSVENIANWDFVGNFKDLAHQLFQDRWNEQNRGPGGADEHFLVVGEELSLPMDLLKQRRLDGLWNGKFRAFVRAAIVGEKADGERSFESTVRRAIDCREIGFACGREAVNYITSHDVEGFRRERLFTMLGNFGSINTAAHISSHRFVLPTSSPEYLTTKSPIEGPNQIGVKISFKGRIKRSARSTSSSLAPGTRRCPAFAPVDRCIQA